MRCDSSFCLQVDMECGFGEVETVELRPNGARVPVTSENVREYVDLYTQVSFIMGSLGLMLLDFRAIKICSI